MSSTECQACGSLTGDTLLLCKSCTQKLGEALIKVSWLVRELEVAYIRAARFTRPTDALARSRTTPLPWNHQASAATLELRSKIGYWAVAVRNLTSPKIGPQRPPLPDDTWRRALFLAGNLPNLRAHHNVAGAYRELTGAINNAQVTVDCPPDMQAYGVCGAELASRKRCNGYLYAAPDALDIECPRCRTSYALEERRRWMTNYVRDMVGTVSEVAYYLKLVGMKVTEDSLRAMIRRHPHEVPPRATNAAGVSLYRFAQVIDVVSARYQRRPKPGPKVSVVKAK